MDFKIKKLSLLDLEQLAACEETIFTSSWSEEILKNQLESKYAYNLGCYHDEDLVGYLLATRIFDESELLKIGTLSEQRKKGIGTKLLSQYLNANLGCCFFLEVASDNQEAISLYEKNHFITYQTRKDYYGLNNDAILMKREVL